jgi:hypothetical protein
VKKLLKKILTVDTDTWWVTPILLCILAQVCDVTSSLHVVNGFYETNPFTRHADGSFWLLRGVAVKLYWLIVYSVVAIGGYWSLDQLNVKWARLAFAAPYIYFAYIAFIAATSNLLNYTGWYTPLVQHFSVFVQ